MLVTSSLRKAVAFLQVIFFRFDVFLSVNYRRAKVRTNDILLNIGCGNSPLVGFTNCDIESSHYQSRLARGVVRYDMRKDKLPFADESVAGIYCSHVIEHIEDVYVERFFADARRVLVRGGVLRISVPDSVFLFRMWKEAPQYFCWHKFFKEDQTGTKSFFRLIAGGRKSERNFGLGHDIQSYGYSDLMASLEDGVAFDDANPQLHISNWDFEKIRRLAGEAGFTKVLESKPGGSVLERFQRPDIDTTHSQMSLYADLVKL